MIGVSVVALFTVFGDSLKASASKGIDDTLTADVVVDTPGYGGQSGASGFAPQLAQQIATIPGVRSATGVRGGNSLINGATHAITVADPATVGDVLDLDVAGGAIDQLDASSIAVSDDVARHERLERGQHRDDHLSGRKHGAADDRRRLRAPVARRRLPARSGGMGAAYRPSDRSRGARRRSTITRRPQP